MDSRLTSRIAALKWRCSSRSWLISRKISAANLFQTFKHACRMTPTLDYKLYTSGELLKENKKLQDYRMSNESLILIEYKTLQTWMLFNQLEVMKRICHYCRAMTELPVICRCKLAIYCSNKCKDRDSFLHSQKTLPYGLRQLKMILIITNLIIFYRFFRFISIIIFKKMITGKIYRNKPIDIQQNFYQTEYQQPLRRVMSNNQLLQSCPSMEINFNQQIIDDRERNWGSAKQYVEKCERRMRERVAAIERRYNLSLEQVQKTLEEKDMVIKALKEALQEKERTIQSLRKDNQQVLSSSRLMLSSSRR